MARDRSVLLGLTSRGAAVRLIARLLLEMGRPEDAGELLRERVALSSEPRDREAAWLLRSKKVNNRSRAFAPVGP